MEIKPYLNTLKKSLIFSELSDREIQDGLAFFSAFVGSYSKGEMLNVVSDPLKCFGIVLEGLVHVCMTDYDGNKAIMVTVSVGEGFGEAFSFLGLETNVYIRAAEDCKILWLNPENVKNATSQKGENNLYIKRFISDLAVRALRMNDRIQIMSKRTLREKLLTFFSILSSQNESKSIDVPFDRNGMAVYLGTDRSSLSRELSKMRREGIIDFRKNHFEIL